MEPGFDSFEDFLRTALAHYFRRRGASKLLQLALLFAAKEAWGVALGHAIDPETGKRVLKGVGGAAAVGLLLRIVLGGPLGMLLAGVSVASLGAVYVKEGAQLGDEVVRVRGVVHEFRGRYAEVDDQARGAGLDRDTRELMMEGLLFRFLVALEQSEHVASNGPDEPEQGGFLAHVAAREAAESRED